MATTAPQWEDQGVHLTGRIDLAEVVSAGLEPGWDHQLERKLFGSDDPYRIADHVTRVVAETTGEAVVAGITYHASVGVTVGLEVETGHRFAVKFVRNDRSALLGGAVEVQRAVRGAGLPAPEHLAGPFRFGEADVLVDAWLDPGEPDHPALPSTRRALAYGLWAMFEATRPLFDSVEVIDPLATAPGSAYAEPHDLRFDFRASGAGAEWIDELNREARAVLDTEPPDAIGHVDWRGGNVVVVDEQLAAIYDWDSAARGSEAVLVGMASATWSLAWEWGCAVHPDVTSADAFVAHFETARGRPLDHRERTVVRAAQIAQLAYTARCEHSDRELGVITGSTRPVADRLHEFATRPASLSW